jgi:endonuclease YncB( thermonuclease family)
MKTMHTRLTRTLLPLLALLSFAGGCGPATEAAAPQAAPEPRAQRLALDRIVDGDTLWVQRSSERVKVRLLRIDTPERGEFGFDQATRELTRWVRNAKSLRLEYDGDRKDRYGRELCYVWADDVLVNAEIVRSGWSPFFTRYGAGKYAAQFERAEREARREKRGLWAKAAAQR